MKSKNLFKFEGGEGLHFTSLLRVKVLSTHKCWSFAPSCHCIVASLLLVDPHISHLYDNRSKLGRRMEDGLKTLLFEIKICSHLAIFAKEVSKVVFCAIVGQVPNKQLL